MEENTTLTQEVATESAQPKEGKKFVKRIPRRKVCAFCQGHVDTVD